MCNASLTLAGGRCQLEANAQVHRGRDCDLHVSNAELHVACLAHVCRQVQPVLLCSASSSTPLPADLFTGLDSVIVDSPAQPLQLPQATAAMTAPVQHPSGQAIQVRMHVRAL